MRKTKIIKEFDPGFLSKKDKGSIVKKAKFYAVLFMLGILVLVLLGFWLVMKINDFFMRYYFKFNVPVEIRLRKPIEIKERKPDVRVIVKEVENLPEPKTPIEKYICERFGVADCKIAIAVAKAESGLREDAVNINRNGTIDVGIFQINSVHFKKPGCSLKEVVDAYKNVDCAYRIWKSQGWEPWVVFKNRSFINFVK